MHDHNEMSDNVRKYFHSRLIEDTGVIFLAPENYYKTGYVPDVVSSGSRNIRLPLAVSGTLSVMAILTLLASSQSSYRIQEHDSDKENLTIVTFPTDIPDGLEEKIQSLPITTTPQDISNIVSVEEFSSNPIQGPKIKSSLDDVKIPTPEEIAYVNSFKSFLDSHLRRRGYVFPKPEELKRARKLPHAFFSTFTVNDRGMVQLAGWIYPTPPTPDWYKPNNFIQNYYTQLFNSMPRFVPPSKYKLSAPYEIRIDIYNALTRDGNRLYWRPYELEKLFKDFDLGKLKE